METSEPATYPASRPAVYSPRAVLGFSMAFSAVAGGVLTFVSLRAAGRPGPAWRALGVSLLYTVLVVVALSYLPAAGSLGALLTGFGGGTLLNELFLKKQLPDEAEYPRRSIVVPLLICLALVGGLAYLIISSMTQALQGSGAG